MPEPICLCPVQELNLCNGLIRTRWNRVVNGERSVITMLKSDGLQEGDKAQDHPNRGEHYARRRIREVCAYRVRSFDRPIEETLAPRKHHHGTNQDVECGDRQTA